MAHWLDEFMQLQLLQACIYLHHDYKVFNRFLFCGPLRSLILRDEFGSHQDIHNVALVCSAPGPYSSLALES